MSKFHQRLVVVIFLVSQALHVASFNLVFMGVRRGKGSLQKSLEEPPESSSSSSRNNPAKTKGQEITGVTLPGPGQLKGWEFGEGKRLVCANLGPIKKKNSDTSSSSINYKFAALQGDCPRCGFDLYRGDLITNDVAWDYQDIVACPTCGTTYNLATGVPGPQIKRKGLQAFVGNLAKTATATDASKRAKAFQITREEDTGKVFLRER